MDTPTEGTRLLNPPQSTENPSNDGNNSNSGAPKKNGLLHKVLKVGIVLIVVAAVTVYYFIFVAPYESTDDAFIAAHTVAMAPQVAGRVQSLLVDDNQEVKAGDLLVQIDPRDYQAALDLQRANLTAARSELAQANAQVATDEAKVDQEKAHVVSAEAEAERADADEKQYRGVGELGVSKSQIDLAVRQSRSSDAAADAARAKQLAAESQVILDKAAVQTAAAKIQQNEASVRQAELNLSYTQITATESGFVTHRTVEIGDYIETGQELLAIVPEKVWIVANFKESLLKHMRPGQTVEARVDAYPKVKFTGHVDSIQHGSGANFSLLPPENATGNYVKVVQRIPVKIVLDKIPNGYVIGPGMSVVPKVTVK